MARERIKPSLQSWVDKYNIVENLESCLQCGKCAGVCPVAKITPSYNPRQIIRDVLDGNEERWLSSEEIWRCFWCATCYANCPMDIMYPLLMMQLRYRAMEAGYGMQYFAPVKRFALRARNDGLTFAPGGEKGRARVMKIRGNIGASPWPEVSDKAKEEYAKLFEICGANKFLEGLNEEDVVPLEKNYMKGRIVDESE